MARDYNDVGRYADEDRCCREHDLCPNSLSPGECKRGLCNNAKFTRSHCDCDARFRRCLQGLNTGTNYQYDVLLFIYLEILPLLFGVADQLGIARFNILAAIFCPKCFLTFYACLSGLAPHPGPILM